MDEQSFPFVVEVLEGPYSKEQLQDGQPSGRISLTGRMLPYWGIKFGVNQRSKTTFYPGNPQGTQQVIGPTLQNTVVHGLWKDRYLGAHASRRLHVLFETLARTGPQMRVTWGAGATGDAEAGFEVSQALVRQGILKRAEFTYDIPQRCAWEFEFEWSSAGEPAVSPVLNTPTTNPREGLLNASDNLEGLAALVDAFQHIQTVSYVGQSLKQLRDVQDAVDQLHSAASAVVTASSVLASGVQVPAQVVGSLVTALSLGASAARQIRATFENFIPSQVVPYDDALALLQYQGDLLAVLHEAGLVQEKAASLADSLGQLSIPDVLAEVRAPAGTDLRQLAQQFYGDSDGWSEIADYNGIQGSFVPMPPTGPSDQTGAPIRIPRRGGTAAGLSAGC